MTTPSRPLENPYADFVHRVQKPARYTGGELGARAKDWDAVDARVCLAFPDVYDIGMSHLGFKILYKILNDDPRTLAERCYAPWIDMQAELRKRALPLVSLETFRPLSEFDVVGFSLQFELTYTNVLAMLDLGGVALRSCDRGEDAPLVIAGGPTATHPEPLADFIDAFVIGDGEERTSELSLLWTKLRREGVPRRERLVALAKLTGVYVPALYETDVCRETGLGYVARPLIDGVPAVVERNLVHDLDKFPFPDDSPVGGPEAIFDRMSIEIARGCTEGCRFCQAGMIYRPVRERDPVEIVETIVRAVKKSGYDEASLTCLSTADYSCIAPLIKKVVDRLAPEKVSLGVSSLRAYGLDEPVLDDIKRVRATGITFAPEAGSQRMRDVINKNVTEEQLMTTAERVFARGWDSMKLYFMIGLPTEEEEDVREIVRVGTRARVVGRRVRRERDIGGAPKVTVSVSTLVPKPHTPFQWCAMNAASEVREKQRWLREEAKIGKVDLRVHASDGSWLEAVFARGDRSLCAVLERAFRGGARFDSWEDQFDLAVWQEAFVHAGVEPQRFLGTLPVTGHLPWDHIDMGLEDGFLLREYQKAVKSRLSPPCGKAAGAFVHHASVAEAKADGRKLVCYDCGVACDLSAMRADRLVALERLGALEPRPAQPLPPPAPRDPEATEVTMKRKAPPRLVQGEPHRFRFRYEKIGAAAYLSHLDVIRALPRTFRRAELPMFYTSGFHPKPDQIFGPALSLGVSSLGEWLDIKLITDLSAEEALARLATSSVSGMRFTGAVRLAAGDPPVSKCIDAARYAVGLPRHALARALGGEPGLVAEVERLLADESRVIVRSIEGIGKRVDVRRFLRTMRVGDALAAAWLEAAGFVSDLVPVLVDVDVTANGGVKVAEVIEALVGRTEDGEPSVPFRAVRAELGRRVDGAVVLPLEVDVMRASVALASPPAPASPEPSAVAAAQ